MFLLEDKLLNDRLIREHLTEHDNVLNSRISRMQSALTQHMGQTYSIAPIPLLQNLLDRITRYETYYNENPLQKWLNKKQEVQNLIDTGQYARANTPEYDYHINYYSHLNNFQWPDANELAIRQQEESNLLALLNV